MLVLILETGPIANRACLRPPEAYAGEADHVPEESLAAADIARSGFLTSRVVTDILSSWNAIRPVKHPAAEVAGCIPSYGVGDKSGLPGLTQHRSGRQVRDRTAGLP
jgi:hypothetical protein